MSKKLYLRSPKKPDRVKGPFSRNKIQSLIHAGKVHREFEVSDDALEWLPITSVKPALFTPELSNPATAEGNAKIDLTVVEQYVPSGKCKKPLLIFPFTIASPVIVSLAMILGGGIGFVAGFVLIGIPGMLLDQFLGGVIQDITGGWSVRNIGANIGAWIGVLAGGASGFALLTQEFHKRSHNRSKAIAAVFGLMISGATLGSVP